MSNLRITPFIFQRLSRKVIPPKKPTTVEVDQPVNIPGPDQKVWRYLSFEKFVDLLRSQKLYCRRLDKLPDALEGLLSAGNCRQMSPVTQAFHDGYDIKEDRDQIVFESELTRRHLFVSCWHINDFESRTMWCLYAPRSESVVVVSRVAMLWAYAQSCNYWQVGRVILSNVKYADFDYPRPDWVDWGPALIKDLIYRFEREIRLIATPSWPAAHIRRSDCFKIPVAVLPLIEEVIFHPHACSGFCQEVLDLARRHLPGVLVTPSRIRSRLW